MDPPPRGAQEDAVQQNNNDDNEVDYGGTMNLHTFYSIFKVPSNNICIYIYNYYNIIIVIVMLLLFYISSF